MLAFLLISNFLSQNLNPNTWIKPVKSNFYLFTYLFAIIFQFSQINLSQTIKIQLHIQFTSLKSFSPKIAKFSKTKHNILSCQLPFLRIEEMKSETPNLI